MPTSADRATQKPASEIPVSHVCHATAEAVGAEVHAKVRVHGDRHWILALDPRIAAQLGRQLIKAAKRRKYINRKQPTGAQRLPLLKPSGGIL